MKTDIEARKKTASFAEEALVVEVQSMLHSVMEERRVTRAELARQMGVSRARVTQMFSDDGHNFTLKLLARACHALGERAEMTCQTHRRLESRRAAASGRVAMQNEVCRSSDDWTVHAARSVNDNGRYAEDMQVAAGATADRLVELVGLGSRSERRAA